MTLNRTTHSSLSLEDKIDDTKETQLLQDPASLLDRTINSTTAFMLLLRNLFYLPDFMCYSFRTYPKIIVTNTGLFSAI